MNTCDITISIHAVHRAGDPHSHGSDRFEEFGAAAGVSSVSSRQERKSVVRMLDGGWGLQGEIGGLGAEPSRKVVRIALPDGVSYGYYNIANVEIHGLHGEHSTRDGMGRTVYCYCRETRLMDPDESNETAIDRAIASGIMLSVPQADGSRAEIEATVIAVSDLYGERKPDNWV